MTQASWPVAYGWKVAEPSSVLSALDVLDAHSHLSGPDSGESAEGIASGVFLDGYETRFCRPAFFEAVREVPVLKEQLAQLRLDCLPHQKLAYGSDGWWPMSGTKHQLGLFEVAATHGHLASGGSDERTQLRRRIFYGNAWERYSSLLHDPRPAATAADAAQDGADRGRSQ